MKKLIVTMITVLALAGVAVAAETAPQAKETPAPQAASAPDQKFDQWKATILKKIDAQEAKLKESRACIEAAKDKDALKACRPKHKSSKHHKKDKPKLDQPAPAAQPQAK